MRKFVIGIIVVICFICYISNKETKEEELRVRIIPNSNNKEDLEIKEEVKSIVVYYLEELYSSDYNTYFNNINNSYHMLEDIIDKKISDVSISFNYHTLYNKAYNNSAVENECFYTLYIVINEGKGSNWWSSIYPEFLASGGSEEIKYKSLILELIDRMED